jgi:D-sedoheptulose 7-phosphate isomerase
METPMPSERIARLVQEHLTVLEVFREQAEELAGFAGQIVDVFNGGGKLLVAGTGPLAAVASMVATEFMHRLSLERPPLPAVALTHDAILAGALARDGQEQQYFARQVQMLAAPGDILLAFRGLGHEASLAEAMAAARQAGCFTAAFFPGRSEPPGEKPDFLFRLEADSFPRAIEGAVFFGHVLCELVEAELFGI